MFRHVTRSLLIAAIASLGFPSVSLGVVLWTVHHGETRISLDHALLKNLGLAVASNAPDDESTKRDSLVLEVPPDGLPIVMNLEQQLPVGFAEGTIRHSSGLRLTLKGRSVDVNDLAINIGEIGASGSGLIVGAPQVQFSRESRAVTVASDELAISRKLALELGQPLLSGAVIGRVESEVFLAWDGGELPPEPSDDTPTPRACASPNPGPDVIVGDLQGISNYSVSGGIDAFSVGTYSCNIGNVPLAWVSSTNKHPVIPQSMYRYKVVNGAGRFEQIGISWCKHGFTALSDTICCPCTGPGGAQLGVGCADPYTSGRNGIQITTVGGLGPRFDINAHNGFFNYDSTTGYPFKNTNGGVPVTSITRRLQVKTGDLSSSQNPGAQYYVEAQYVTPDDAAYQGTGSPVPLGVWTRNQNNNCSYRPITISGTTSFTAALTATGTTRQAAAIKAWKSVHDPSVTETLVDTPEAESPAGSGNTTGRLILSAKATNVGGATWHYEYALFNMNSDRSISSFSVPVPAGSIVSISTTGDSFHDVDYHSGDGFGSTPTAQVTFDGSDWPAVYSGGSVTWTMVPASPLGNSNALRWGTQYNFRFDVNAGPGACNVTLGLFKPVAGLPDSMSAGTIVPCAPPVIGPLPPVNTPCGVPYGGSTPSVTGSCTIAWSLAGSPPAGMTINPGNGVISWPTPDISGSPYTITVQATNACGSDSESFQLTVDPNPPTIDPMKDELAVCGSAYESSAKSVSGGVTPYSWSLSGSPPAGMTVNPATGAVSWPDPLASGSPYTISLTASCVCGADTKSYQLTVDPTAPSIQPISDAFAVCGAPYTSPAPSATGSATPYVWSLGGTPPAGMTIDPGSGVISWPSPVASLTPYQITVQVDAAGECGGDAVTYNISVVIGDYNSDGFIDAADIPGFVDNLLGLTNYCAGDLNDDGVVNGDDVPVLIANLP